MQNKIEYYIRRHRLSLKQIAELKEYKDIKVPTETSQKKTFLAMAKVAELIRLSNIFTSNNIHFIPFKGPLLSFRLHGDYFYRYFADLDILIGINDIERCVQILKKEGYKTFIYDLPKDAKKKNLVFKMNNQIQLFHPKKQVTVELHWHLFKYPIIDKSLLEQLILTNQTTIVVQKTTFTVFTKEFGLIYLVIHGSLHAWRRIKWLHDIYALCKDKELNWGKVLDLSATFKVNQLIFQSIYLANHFWNIPDFIIKKFENSFSNLKPVMIKFPFEAINREEKQENFLKTLKYIYRHMYYTLTLFPSIKYKMSNIKRFLFSEKELKKINLPNILIPLYFIISPVNRVIKRISKNNKSIKVEK